ncbi:MAG: PilZ domain-containing protein [Hyphomicrobiales bacterium]|uniref:PilZ domain-containing protein n=1 Tax=Rhabdaerophilum calidifontis TaxID=2604328 RepID=UPI00123BA9C2|nr:PilZ domain-containing protein [Rhabdaerophilum calidifontis]MCA1951559.1 PilZ domain-containing protein [Hyphomicrobiales bacterium]
MLNNRRENRNACYLRASILIKQGDQRIDAEAFDISKNGMRLVVPNARQVPDYFMVSIPRRHMMEHVRVVRRGDSELGVVIRELPR